MPWERQAILWTGAIIKAFWKKCKNKMEEFFYEQMQN
jgi:hypothetical protein